MPALQDHSIAGSGYGNPYVDSLVWGQAGWNVASGPITYFLADASTAGDDPTSASFDGATDVWSAAERAAFVQVLAAYSSVCGLTFAEASTVQSANLVEWQVSDTYWPAGAGTLGEHEVPTGGAGHNSNAQQIWGYFNDDAAGWSSLSRGGDGFYTLIHEFGHAMGLAHPHDGGYAADASTFPGVTASGDTGDYGLNQGPFTVMSYNADYDGAPATSLAFGEAGGLGAFDIAALQTLYGANMATAAGDDVYTLPTLNAEGTFWSCIWDAGGHDLIDASASTLNAHIDLRPAPLTGDHAGGYLSSNAGVAGGFTIANGVVIEDAAGGSGADLIVGNTALNVLKGNAGHDTLIGDAGDDTLYGGDASDELYGDGRTAQGPGVGMGSGTLTKTENYGNRSLATAADVSNLFSLNANSDIANSTTSPHVSITAAGDGNIDFYKLDVAAGTTLTLDVDHSYGFDAFLSLYDAAGNRLSYDDDSSTTDGAGGSTSTQDSFLVYQVSAAGTYYVSIGAFMNATTAKPISRGTLYNLHLSVEGSAAIGSGEGADVLDGGAGADFMQGGLGSDTYYVDDPNDRVNETAVNGGTDTVIASASYSILYTQVENLQLTGSAGISATGNDLANLVTGNAGANAISGGAGADTIIGGGGADTMSGGVGNDFYYVDATGDKIVEASNEGTDTVHATAANYTLSDNIERLYFDDAGNHTGKGNALSNLIYGNAGLDKFIIDAGGNDTFSGGAGEDTFDARSSTTGMVLRLDAQANNAGSVAGDTFAAIEKFFGSDTAADAMTTGAARAKFFGYGGDDTLTGGASIDALSGGAGNDSLVGNGGQDALDGGVGNDTMTGGAAKDIFTFVDASFGQDVVTDFQDGVDRLKIYSAVADSFDDFTVTGNGTHHVVLTLNAATANTITLDNASANITISAADFLFY